MGTTATSLKLPAELKERLQEIAERSGQSPHAYMLAALQERVRRMSWHNAFSPKRARRIAR